MYEKQSKLNKEIMNISVVFDVWNQSLCTKRKETIEELWFLFIVQDLDRCNNRKCTSHLVLEDKAMFANSSNSKWNHISYGRYVDGIHNYN